MPGGRQANQAKRRRAADGSSCHAASLPSGWQRRPAATPALRLPAPVSPRLARCPAAPARLRRSRPDAAPAVRLAAGRLATGRASAPGASQQARAPGPAPRPPARPQAALPAPEPGPSLHAATLPRKQPAPRLQPGAAPAPRLWAALLAHQPREECSSAPSPLMSRRCSAAIQTERRNHPRLARQQRHAAGRSVNQRSCSGSSTGRQW